MKITEDQPDSAQVPAQHPIPGHDDFAARGVRATRAWFAAHTPGHTP